MPLTPASSSIPDHDMEGADVLVLYGITGDLAKKMLLPALYKLTERGELKVPVIGVAASDRDDEALRKHARQSVLDAGYEIDEDVFKRLSDSLNILQAALTGDSSGFAFFPTIEESWRIVSKILDPKTPPLEYDPGSWGPDAAAEMAGGDGWHAPAKQLFADGEIEVGAPTGPVG